MVNDTLNRDNPGPANSALTDAGHNRRALERLVKDYQDREAARWRWQHFELQLIRSQDLGTLLDLLLRQAERYFGLESAVLELLDLDHSWSKCLERGPQPQSPHLLLTEDPATLERRFPLGVKVRVIRRDDSDGRTLLIPLVRQGALMGSLRFEVAAEHRLLAIDNLTHFAAIATTCLESCRNRELLHQQSLVDILTGVLNRRGFEQCLREECARALRSRQPLTAMFVDLDHFKRVNDRYGHPCGDRVLALIAESIGEMLRPTDILSRYGGEEFVALLPACDETQAGGIAERINQAVVARPLKDDNGGSFRLSCSVGYSCWLRPGADSGDSATTLQRLITRADQALYRAKQGGRNRACYQPLES